MGQEMPSEEKQRLIEAEIVKIQQQTRQREEQLQQAALKTHWDHELRFGKLMMAQDKYATAIAHFDKILHQVPDEDSYHHGEARLQKAECLQKMGAADESRQLYQSLLRYRGTYHHIKRRAAQALFLAQEPRVHAPDEPPSLFDDHMYRMFMSGFGARTQGRAKEGGACGEELLLQVLPWSVVLVAPLLALAVVVGGRS